MSMSATNADPSFANRAVQPVSGRIAIAVLLICVFFMAVAQAKEAPDAAVPPTSVSAVVVVDGEVETPLRLDFAALAGMPRVKIRASDHGTTGEWEGVPLIEILRRAGVPTGEALRGRNLQRFVRIGAADGYAVVYALAELDPRFSDDPVILADTRDGERLSAHEGPLRVVAPADKRAGRWVRQVDVITVMMLGEPLR